MGKASAAPPVATIVSVTPNPVYQGEIVTFLGEGSDEDGTIEAYEWILDGNLQWNTARVDYPTSSLSIGTHTLTFRVMDNDLYWSATQRTTFRVVQLSTDTSTGSASNDLTCIILFLAVFFLGFFGIFGLVAFTIYKNTRQTYNSPTYSYSQPMNTSIPEYYNRYSVNRNYVNPYYRPPSTSTPTYTQQPSQPVISAKVVPDLSTPKGRAEKAISDAQEIIFSSEFKPQAIELFNKAQYAYADEKYEDAEKLAKDAVDALSNSNSNSK